MSSKDELLANFQAGSGIEDVGRAFTILESCDWDLPTALSAVMSGAMDLDMPMIMDEFPSFGPRETRPSSFGPIEPNVMEVEDPPIEPPRLLDLSAAAAVPSIPSTSQTSVFEVPSPINVNIQLVAETGNVNPVSCPLEIPATTSFIELKSTLYQIFGLPICDQVITGFTRPVSSDDVITNELLPTNKTLVLNTGGAPTIRPIINGGPSGQYNLLIHDETHTRDYNLHYDGSTLVTKVKDDLVGLSKISVPQQIWSGWPPRTTDMEQLRNIGMRNPLHLTISNAQPQGRPQHKRTRKSEPIRVDDSSDEFEDASDHMTDDFIDMEETTTRPRSKYLIPAHASDEESGVDQFCNNFRARFGTNIPAMYNGKLESALKDSVMLPAKSRRLLAVYLHHDGSIISNVFCSQVICHQSVVEFLGSNFVVWGWDLSHESNKARLLNLVTTHFGGVAASTIRRFDTEKYPVLLLLNRTRGIVEILSVIHGSLVLDEVMTSLIHAVEIFDGQRRSDIVDEDAREQREAMKAEQDAAYHESLLIDRAKAEAKRKAEFEERTEREYQRNLKEKADAIKLSTRALLESQLSEEPSEDCPEPKTTFRFRQPGKELFRRTFLLSTKLQVVLNFLTVKGFPADEFKCIQSWPRRDITTLETSKTLADLNMHTQETLNVEER